MNNPTQIAQSAVLTLLERGVNFLVEEACYFVEKNGLDKTIPLSQLNCLQNIFLWNAGEPAKQKDEVKEFINKQIEKDKKRSGKGWAKAGNPLFTRLFEFSNEKQMLHDQVKKILKNSNRLSNELENSLDDLFNSAFSDSMEWQKKTLEPELCRKMLDAILTVYQCRKAGLSVPVNFGRNKYENL